MLKNSRKNIIANNSYFKLSLAISLIVFFILFNSWLIAFLFFVSGNVWLEVIKWLQINLFFVIIFYWSRLTLGKLWSFLILFLLYFFYFSLAAYHFITHTQLDYNFLSRNFNNLSIILASYKPILGIIVSFAFIGAFCFCLLFKQKVFQLQGKKFFISGGIILLFLFSPALTSQANNELVHFIKSIFHSSPIINEYQKYYKQLIKNNIKFKNIIQQQSYSLADQTPSSLDNIIILHLESLNGFLVNATNTPNFIKLSRHGIFFPYFYGNGMQTIMGQESILCSLPGSFDLKLFDIKADKKIICLPSFLKELGYRTYFFTGGHLFSDHTGQFMANIGFSEIHNQDITNHNDPHYTWGYREDIFYQRVFQYLNKQKTKRNFIYIDVGATHHWPFAVPKDYTGPLPYPEPKNFTQRFANTLFIQDSYLKIAWQELNKTFPQKNYTVLILGDHSWPAGLHPGNTFNQKGAYEENFRTALVLILGKAKQFQGITITKKFSQLDIMPSLLELFGINMPTDGIRQSFIKAIKQQSINNNHLIILVQPYDHKYLGLVRENDKYLYDGLKNSFSYFNLATDPAEKQGEIIGNDNKTNLSIFFSLINFRH